MEEGGTARAVDALPGAADPFYGAVPPTLSALQTVRNQLAENYASQGNVAAAEQVQRAILGDYEQTVGEEHTLVATTLHDLGTSVEGSRRMQDAIDLHERAYR